ncbi:thiol reductant ABC exporter subunit CydC [Apilactobacillus micheneri]|uniref:thiol reductant ABC exporter subunit CydC n=1 Tax=Apilactobacillus micheneri TaxID=1899430 RepID=UPI000D50646D|nr:thiol reductant ABC exporter subunit CydC [Apilactobacillus micheneri]GAY79870.1 putative ABC transporter ATP-binding protein [Apilactobacillus micheneri]
MRNFFNKDTWIKPYLKKDKKLLFTAFGLGIVTIICSIGLMFVAGYLISRSATRPYNILIVYIPVILAQAFGTGRPVFQYLEQLTSHNWVLGVVSKLRQRLYMTLEKGADFVGERFKLGNLLGVLSDDLEHLEDLYLKTIFPIITSYITGILIIILLGIVSIPYALFMFVCFAVILLVMPIISVIIFGKAKKYEKDLVANNYQNLTDATLGVTDWMISGRKKDFIGEGTKNDKKLAKSRNKVDHFEWNRDFSLRSMIGVIIVGSIIWGNIYLNDSQSISNYIAAFVLGVFPLLDTFIPVSQAMENWPIYKGSVNRLNNLSNTLDKEEINATENNFDPNEINSISMNDVSFKYDDDNSAILNNISLNVKQGQKLAIIGPSGVGKTTLLQLLLGSINPTKGEVKINNVKVTDLQNNRSNIFSVLDQQPFLFDTTIINNVMIGNEQATFAEAKQALSEVGLADYIETLPKKYDTDIDESGIKLSGGQRQRLAIARILLQDNPIVLLDEPTVGLDPITENNLINTLNQVLRNKTIIWVTHHLQGLSTMDEVIFLQKGTIQMDGSPSELYKNNKKYRKLYQMDQGIEN